MGDEKARRFVNDCAMMMLIVGTVQGRCQSVCPRAAQCPAHHLSARLKREEEATERTGLIRAS